jgi:ABC transport system ATP-binding/permease protein
MNILNVDSIAKQFSERVLFAEVSFGLESRDRVGVIGRNGSGKSTLLRVVAGLEPPDTGRVTLANGLRLAYLPQNPELNAAHSVLEELFGGEAESTRLLREYEQLSAQLEQRPNDQALHARLAELLPRMDAAGAWEAEARVRTVLTRLGIGDLLDTSVGALSGGQRKRVAMAQALIDQPDLLLLDEPTNHIDTETIAWLEGELARWPGALLLVTHDRYFLDRVVTRMVEIDAGRAAFYSGGYSSFLEQKAAQAVQAEAAELARQNLLRRELAWLRRGARARSTKQKAHVERVQALAAQQGPAKKQELEVVTAAGRRLGTKVLRLAGAQKAFGERVVLRDFSFIVEPGDRLGIIGPNGSGKSSLLNMIAGRLAPDAGVVELGETVQLGYYDQESSALDPAQRAIDYVKEGAEVLRAADGSTLTATQLLERFLFPGPAQYTPIGRLSGGEKRRLYLLRTLMFAPNLLLLDEPTNDLDIATLSVLEDYLEEFAGTLIAVSHDRYFLDRTVDRLLVFEGDGRVVEFPGSYSAWHEAQEALQETRRQGDRERAGRPTQNAPAKAPTPLPNPTASGGQRRLSYKEQQELKQLETRIAQLEARQKALYATLAGGGDYQQAQKAGADLAALEAELEAALERWMALEERR